MNYINNNLIKNNTKIKYFEEKNKVDNNLKNNTESEHIFKENLKNKLDNNLNSN